MLYEVLVVFDTIPPVGTTERSFCRIIGCRGGGKLGRASTLPFSSRLRYLADLCALTDQCWYLPVARKGRW